METYTIRVGRAKQGVKDSKMDIITARNEENSTFELSKQYYHSYDYSGKDKHTSNCLYLSLMVYMWHLY